MKIEGLFEEAANLYGDRFNLRYLEESLHCSGLNVKVLHTSLYERPNFLYDSEIKLIYLGSMTEHFQALAAKQLLQYKEIIKQKINDGVIFLLTGNAGEIFGEYIEDMDSHERIECLGVYPYHAERHMMERYYSLYLGNFAINNFHNITRNSTSEISKLLGLGADNLDLCSDEAIKIVGFKAQFSHSFGDNSKQYLFTTEKGCGFHRGTKLEGIHDKNFYSTYLIGPLLILNPLFTKYLMHSMGVQDPILAHESTALNAYRNRLRNFCNLEGHEFLD